MNNPLIVGTVAHYGQPHRPAGGGGHSFITALTLLIVTDRPEKLQFSRGHSHDEALGYASNNYANFDHTSQTPVTYADLNVKYPIVWRTKFRGNTKLGEDRWAYLEEAYPNFKFINISFTKEDTFIMGAYHFFKMHRFSNIVRKHTKSPGERLVNSYFEEVENGTIRPGLTNFSELSFSEIHVLLNRPDSDQATYLLEVDNRRDPPIEYQSRIYEVKFNDIHHNKNKVLETLSRATGKDITLAAIESYDDYLQAQIEVNGEINNWRISPK